MKTVSYCNYPSDYQCTETKMYQDDYGDKVVFYTYTEDFKGADGMPYTVAVFHIKAKHEKE